MSIFAATTRQGTTPPGRSRMLVAVLTTVAIVAVFVLAAVLLGLSQTPGDGRVPHPEPAPAPILQR
jgi:hypothetical protein